MMRCFICHRTEGKIKLLHWWPILPGNVGPSPPSIKKPAHHDCHKRWYEETYRAYAELDKSLNECLFFERAPGSLPGTKHDGYYCHNGLRLPCKSFWRQEEMETAHPQLIGTKWWKSRWDTSS